MKAFALRLAPGDDLRLSLERVTREQGFRAAFVASCVGSVTRAAIRFADRRDARVVEGPFEIVSLVGTLSQDGAHLHIAVADTDGQMLGGHLGAGTLIHTTAEIVIGIPPDLSFSRSNDAATGYRELVVTPDNSSSGG